MSEFYSAERQAANLIGLALRFGGNGGLEIMERTKRLTVLPNTQPTEIEESQFQVLLQNETIRLDRFGVMIRVGRDILTDINLRSGYYGLGQGRLEGAMLYLARQLGGWEDPTGEHPPEEK